jgi:hypothetical protein
MSSSVILTSILIDENKIKKVASGRGSLMNLEEVVLRRVEQDADPGPGKNISLLPEKDDNHGDEPCLRKDSGDGQIDGAQEDKHKADDKKKSPGLEKPAAEEGEIQDRGPNGLLALLSHKPDFSVIEEHFDEREKQKEHEEAKERGDDNRPLGGGVFYAGLINCREDAAEEAENNEVADDGDEKDPQETPEISSAVPEEIADIYFFLAGGDPADNASVEKSLEKKENTSWYLKMISPSDSRSSPWTSFSPASEREKSFCRRK